MLRSFGRMFLAALAFGAGCRDMTMDLLPPPSASAGTGDEGGMAGDTPLGDAAEGGTGGSHASGGFGGTGPGYGGGGYGGSGACGPGTNCPPCVLGSPSCPCLTDESCQQAFGLRFCSSATGRCVDCLTNESCQQSPGLPYCSNLTGHCVECLARECPPGGTCGCGDDEICGEGYYCVPRCKTDVDCKDNRSRKHCYDITGTCVECSSSDECAEDKPICNLSYLSQWYLTCQPCTEPGQCAEGKTCSQGRCIPHP